MMLLVQIFWCAAVACIACSAGQVTIDLTNELENDKMPLMPNTTYQMAITNSSVFPNQTETINMNTAVGTHVQAPCRYSPGKACISNIALDSLTGRAFIMSFNVTDPSKPISAQQIKDWQNTNGAVTDKSIVIINTDWGQYWTNSSKYAGANVTNSTNMVFPGLHPEAALELIKMNVAGVGIDTMSLDYGQSNGTYAVHKAFADAGIFAILNVASMKSVAQKTSKVYVMPMKIKGASAAPCRLFVVQNGGGGLLSKSILVAVCLAALAYLK